MSVTCEQITHDSASSALSSVRSRSPSMITSFRATWKGEWELRGRKVILYLQAVQGSKGNACRSHWSCWSLLAKGNTDITLLRARLSPWVC